MSRFNEFQFLARQSCVGIGSTDAKQIAEGNWDTLWDEKTGKVEHTDLTFVWKPRLGLATEDLHAWWHGLKECKNLTGPQLLSPPMGPDKRSQAVVGENIQPMAQAMPAHREGGMFFTSIDRWVVEDDCPLELKHTYAGNSLHAAAQTYMPQLQWQMMVVGTERLRFSIIRGNEEPEWGYVEYDPAYAEQLAKQARSFWQHVIDGDRPPSLQPSEELAEQAKVIKVAGTRAYDYTTNNEWCSAAGAYVEGKAAADKFKADEKALRALIPDDAGEIKGGGIEVKRDKAGRCRITVVS